MVIRILGFKIKYRVLYVQGENNEIYANGEKIDYEKLLKQKSKLDIRIIGDNNKIYLPDLKKFTSSIISIVGDDNVIEIKDTCHEFWGLCINMENKSNNRKVFIDENCSSNYNFDINCSGNNVRVTIGKDCMFGHITNIRTTDHHYVYDLETDERLNAEEDVIIGNHVWTANQSFISKGSVVPNGCIVAMRALVNKKFNEENCILAGLPAKVTKKNIRWER